MKIKYLAIFLIGLTGNIVMAAGIDANKITLQTNTGMISLDDLKGKSIYLDFWASWCGPCRKSFPWMNQMHKKYAANGLYILAVNVDQEPKLASIFLNKTPAKFSIAYNTSGTLAKALNLKAMPSSFLINTQGKIAKRHAGFKSENALEYEKSIRTLLGLPLLNEDQK